MNNVDFHCRRSLDGDSVQAVVLSEVEIEPRVKVDCVPKFCSLGLWSTYYRFWWWCEGGY